ncbi:MAG: ATP-grasp domain-containing protein [Arthrospira platensis]
MPGLWAGALTFVEALERVVAEHDYDLVFPSSDGEMLVLSAERERIGALVPYASHETLLKAVDKRGLADAARAAGLATPPSAPSAGEARALWGEGPVVVKESLHGTFNAAGEFNHLAPESYPDTTAAEPHVERIRMAGGEPLVQPLIAGDLMAFSSVLDGQGRMLARVQQIAERTYPRQAGLSVRARTTAVEENLAEQAGCLLRSLGWLGLCELQFIVPPSGPPVLLDLNGRFYGSMSLAIAAGVNLPDLWARAAMKLAVSSAVDARAGVSYQWLEGDLRAAREDSRGMLRDAADCLRYGRGANASIWSVEDPMPGAYAAMRLTLQLARRSAARKPAGRRAIVRQAHEKERDGA